MTSELELNRKRLDFNAAEIHLLSFGWSYNCGTINVKMDGSVLEEKLSFKMLLIKYFSSKLDSRFFIVSVAKTTSKKVWNLDLFYEVSFS